MMERFKMVKFAMLALLVFLSGFSGLVAITDTNTYAANIADRAAAVEFCRSLPDGQPSPTESFDYCAFTVPDSEEPCVVSTSGSFPNFSGSCGTSELATFIGKDDEELRTSLLENTESIDESAGSRGGSSGSTSSGACDVGPGESVEQDKALQCIFDRISKVVFLLSLLIGIALLASTIYAGIQYITAGADAGKVQKAKGRLASNIIVLVLFLFSASILNWILPGS